MSADVIALARTGETQEELHARLLRDYRQSIGTWSRETKMTRVCVQITKHMSLLAKLDPERWTAQVGKMVGAVIMAHTPKPTRRRRRKPPDHPAA